MSLMIGILTLCLMIPPVGSISLMTFVTVISSDHQQVDAVSSRPPLDNPDITNVYTYSP